MSSSNDSFYFDPSIRSYFKSYLKTILTRKNSLTGIEYRDDLTIFAWELMNEPHYSSDKSGDTLQVTVEKNELKAENVALAAEIARLHNELRESLHFDPTWQNNGTDQAIPTQPTSAAVPVAQPLVALYVLPFHQDSKTCLRRQ